MRLVSSRKMKDVVSHSVDIDEDEIEKLLGEAVKARLRAAGVPVDVEGKVHKTEVKIYARQDYVSGARVTVSLEQEQYTEDEATDV